MPIVISFLQEHDGIVSDEDEAKPNDDDENILKLAIKKEDSDLLDGQTLPDNIDLLAGMASQKDNQKDLLNMQEEKNRENDKNTNLLDL